MKAAAASSKRSRRRWKRRHERVGRAWPATICHVLVGGAHPTVSGSAEIQTNIAARRLPRHNTRHGDGFRDAGDCPPAPSGGTASLRRAVLPADSSPPSRTTPTPGTCWNHRLPGGQARACRRVHRTGDRLPWDRGRVPQQPGQCLAGPGEARRGGGLLPPGSCNSNRTTSRHTTTWAPRCGPRESWTTRPPATAAPWN